MDFRANAGCTRSVQAFHFAWCLNKRYSFRSSMSGLARPIDYARRSYCDLGKGCSSRGRRGPWISGVLAVAFVARVRDKNPHKNLSKTERNMKASESWQL